MAVIKVELELSSLEDGSEHDFDYFREDLKEFFAQFGWKLLRTSLEDEDYEDELDEGE